MEAKQQLVNNNDNNCRFVNNAIVIYVEIIIYFKTGKRT